MAFCRRRSPNAVKAAVYRRYNIFISDATEASYHRETITPSSSTPHERRKTEQ